jgi:hypothetical protein
LPCQHRRRRPRPHRGADREAARPDQEPARLGAWLASFGCCAAGLLVALALVRPLTLGILAQGAAFALAFPLGFATVGLLLTLRRPADPIGWLYAGAGLAWSWGLPFGPWIQRLVRDHRLRDQVDLDALQAELLAVVDQTMQPTQASPWLRGGRSWRPG